MTTRAPAARARHGTTRARARGAACALVLVAFAPRGAAASKGDCRYRGRTIAQGVAVCQAGLVQLCMNGEWQDQGRFCSAPDGSVLGKPFLGPGQVDVQTPEEPVPPR
ncbi:MAG TPA: hypothetical protein VFD92_28545 [Candidatus Binatia bacterium]|nr:hypothetical protein [Candidatus Binatia bacterium]